MAWPFFKIAARHRFLMRAPDFLLGLLDAITAGYALIVLALQVATQLH
jgi:hypothetical protein